MRDNSDFQVRFEMSIVHKEIFVKVSFKYHYKPRKCLCVYLF